MPQLLLQGFPDGAIRIGTTVSVLKKDGCGTGVDRECPYTLRPLPGRGNGRGAGRTADLVRQWPVDRVGPACVPGSEVSLPRRYVSREKLCLRGTTDYWVNDALGRPFFVVSQPLTDGLAATLLDQIVPELLESVPDQPSEAELAADPLRHRFVLIFDREGASHSLLSKLWEKRIGAITYRKADKDLWPATDFSEVEVPVPGGGLTRMPLATRQTALTAGKAAIPVLEVRRLTQTGHQTAIITTAQRLQSPVVADPSYGMSGIRQSHRRATRRPHHGGLPTPENRHAPDL